MSSTRMEEFRNFLTAHLTTFAVEVFGEVQSIVEEYNVENKRLRSILRMVLNPKIKLSKIDINQYNDANTEINVQPAASDSGISDPLPTISDPLPTVPKEEQIEYNISSESNQEDWSEETETIQVCVKEDPDEGQTSVPHIAASYHVQQCRPDTSGTVSAEEERDENSESLSMESGGVAAYSPQSESEESMSTNMDVQVSPETSNTGNEEICLQKTMLQVPRMMLHGATVASTQEQLSFLHRLHEAFKDFPEEEKPLITKMGLTTDVEWVECAVGLVPKGSPLSYHLPLPSSKDFKPNDDAYPQPVLPLSHHTLGTVSTSHTLRPEEQECVNDMLVTWDEAHLLENSTRGCKESAEKLQKMRITSRFREICKLKPGQNNAEPMLSKMQRGHRRCKTIQIDEETKPGAIREYCRHSCVNWSPCGLVVHPSAPWLAVMPDGLVYDPKEERSYGLLHIKLVHFQSLIECNFLTFKDGLIQLKKAHPYYWHIQAEMMVTGTSWCDLLVYSRGDILVQRIYRDDVIITLMNKKLEEFFFDYYLPSLVQPKAGVSPSSHTTA